MNMISLSSGNFLKMQNCCILYRDVAWGWSRENNHLDESAEQCCMVMMVMTSRSRHSPHSPLSHRAVCSCSGWWRMFSVTESSSLFTGSSSVLTSSLRGPRQIIPAGGQASTSRQPAPPSHWPGSPHLSQSIGTNIIVCLTYLLLHLTHHTHLTSPARPLVLLTLLIVLQTPDPSVLVSIWKFYILQDFRGSSPRLQNWNILKSISLYWDFLINSPTFDPIHYIYL